MVKMTSSHSCWTPSLASALPFTPDAEWRALGLENNESGWLVGWVMECYERGLLDKNRLDGTEVRWGDADSVRQLLYAVAHRVGFGDTLAEGVMRASQKVGGEAAKAAIYTMKGNTPRGHDHRSRWTEMFDTCTSNTGTLEKAGIPATPELVGAGFPVEVSAYEATAKGLMVFEDPPGGYPIQPQDKYSPFDRGGQRLDLVGHD